MAGTRGEKTALARMMDSKQALDQWKTALKATTRAIRATYFNHIKVVSKLASREVKRRRPLLGSGKSATQTSLLTTGSGKVLPDNFSIRTPIRENSRLVIRSLFELMRTS